MPSLIFQIVSWPTFGSALAVFGFAPGAVLRLIVLAFPREDPRRQELLAEVYAVPRIERPFWVAQQLEVALFEGLRGRFALRIDRMRNPRRRERIAGFVVPWDTRLLVSENGIYKASKHYDVDGCRLPVRFAIGRPVLEQLASDPRFTDLSRRQRKLVLDLLANGSREHRLPPGAIEYWAFVRAMPCPVCGAPGMCGADEVTTKIANIPERLRERLMRTWPPPDLR
jgi:hypothetical protein